MDDDYSCPGCFKEQRSLNDRKRQTIIDAQKISDTENVRIAIFYEPVQSGYVFERIADTIPPGAEIVLHPMQ